MSERKPIIRIRLDVSKLNKERFFKGEKGIYASLILWERQGEFQDDGYVTENIKEEDRIAGERSQICGNWQYLKSSGNSNGGKGGQAPAKAEGEPEIPF